MTFLKKVSRETKYYSLLWTDADQVIMIKIKLESILRIMIEVRRMVILINMGMTKGMEEEAMPAIVGLDYKDNMMIKTEGIIILTKRAKQIQ